MPKLLVAVLVLAFLLRVPFLSFYPIGFTPDEASFGYDAYSILHTGKDQWGHVMPLVLESFGDFKAPLYSYLSIPFIGVLGLTKMAVRLPNALLGVGAVWIVYLLVREMSVLKNTKKQETNSTYGSYLPLTAAFLLAVSPWHVQLSRGAFEANLITFFVPLGTLLFLKGLKNSKYYLWSSIIFGLSLFSYHSAKVIAPLVILFLLVLFWSQILKQFQHEGRKYLIGSAVIIAVFAMLTGITFLQGAGRRASDISIYNGALEAQATDRLAAIDAGMNPTIARILHNKYFVTVDRFMTNYKTYFSSEFLFEKGPREGTYGMMPGVGVLYWFELPLLLSFIFYAIKNPKEKHLWLITLWLLIAPVPASLTQGAGLAANRAAPMVPVIHIASAYGFYYIVNLFTNVIKNKAAQAIIYKSALVLFSLFVVISVGSFILKYIIFSPSLLAKPMLYGNLELAEWLTHTANDRENVISTSLSEPHIYIAFASAWDPTEYQKETIEWARYVSENRTFIDQLSPYMLGNYTFKRYEKEDYTDTRFHYLVGRPNDFLPDVKPVRLFKYINGETAIIVVTPEGNTYAKAF